jgi:RNA exonuclease 1
MFTSKGLFSSIPCPYNDSCVLPKCLFLHSKSDAKNAQSALPESAQDTWGSKNKTHKDVRRKAEVGVASVGLTPKASKSPEIKTALRTVRRDVSPPPLRRAPDNASNTNTIQQQSAVEKAQTEVPAETAAKRQKLETLNPRMLKSSPASHDLRYRLLKALHDQLVRLNNELKQDASGSEEALVLSDQALIIMALDLEEVAAIEKPSIYSNVVKNNILAYKRMSVKDWKDERAKEKAQRDALKSMKSTDSVPSGPPKPIETGLSPEEELAFLPRLYTPIVSLAKHGYVPTVPTEEEIEKARKGVEAAKGWEVCDRCKSRFQVFPGRREEDGALTSGGPCVYHWGKAYLQDRLANDPKAKRERKYRCCGESIGDSRGCTRTDSHVFKVSEVKRLAALLNFEETPENDAGSKIPVCIDGEMGYTVHGLELIRLTATSWPDGNELLDVLVRPIGEVLDLNSRFSGVWSQQMADANPWTPGQDDASPTVPDQNDTPQKELRIVSSPAEARSLLFQHLSPQTPLVGHGLENDLNAVRIVHPTIIDTALLYPHTAGLPYRNGLKALMLKHLGRHIQVASEDKIRGHDSKEDARAAGDLVRYMIGTEWAKMKRNGWTLENGQFVPPKGLNGFQSVPTGPKSMLTVEFLEKDPQTSNGKDISEVGAGADAVKYGTKRPLAEISQDDLEEGEVE